MKDPSVIHPADTLSFQQKCRVYFSRVVDLAVASSLLTSDPDTPIGHFAFSRHYYEGRTLDRTLMSAIARFEREHPEMAAERAAQRNHAFMGAVEQFHRSDSRDKIKDLILVGASYAVWPAGTSFVLTYPWDLEGRGRMVRLRDDLTDFMKRRVIEILKRAGKLGNSDPFGIA